MESLGFSAKEVADRLETVFAPMPSDDAVAARLKERAGYETTGEKVRRTRNGDVQKIGHDLLAAVGIAFDVDLSWLLTGKGKAPDAGYPTSGAPTVSQVKEDLAYYRDHLRTTGGGVSWVPRLIEKVLETERDDRAQLALIEAILAGGRNHTAYGEAMAAVQRGVAMESETGAADGRNITNRQAEQNATIRSIASRPQTVENQKLINEVMEQQIIQHGGDGEGATGTEGKSR